MQKKKFHLGLLVVGAALLAAPVTYAQNGNDDASGTNGTTTAQTENRDDDDTDYGWLGLLGLAGLAGLLKKPQREVVQHTDTVHTTGTGTGNNR